MVIVSEMPKAKEVGSMSLTQIRQHLAEFCQGGKVDPQKRDKLQKKLREILSRLAKVSQRGGQFAQVRPSRQLLELFEQSRWG